MPFPQTQQSEPNNNVSRSSSKHTKPPETLQTTNRNSTQTQYSITRSLLSTTRSTPENIHISRETPIIIHHPNGAQPNSQIQADVLAAWRKEWRRYMLPTFAVFGTMFVVVIVLLVLASLGIIGKGRVVVVDVPQVVTASGMETSMSKGDTATSGVERPLVSSMRTSYSLPVTLTTNTPTLVVAPTNSSGPAGTSATQTSAGQPAGTPVIPPKGGLADGTPITVPKVGPPVATPIMVPSACLPAGTPVTLPTPVTPAGTPFTPPNAGLPAGTLATATSYGETMVASPKTIGVAGKRFERFFHG